MSDRDLDRLITGKAPEGDEELEELAAFLSEVEAAHSEAPSKGTEARQLAAIVEAAQLLSDNGEPAARPASKATGSDRQTSGLPKWRRKLVLPQLFSTLWARVAVVAIAAGLVSGGLASAGALPDPLQAAVADAANQVGVSLQDPDADEPGDVDATDDSTATKGDDDDAKKDDEAKKSNKSNANDDGDDGNAKQGSAGTGNVGTVAPPNDVHAFQKDSSANDPEDDQANEPDDDTNKPDDDADADEGDDTEDQGDDAGESDDSNPSHEEDSGDEGGEDD
jgi:hypothetical protein